MVMLLRWMTAVARGVSGSYGCWLPGHLTSSPEHLGVEPFGDLGRGPPPRSSSAATGVRVRERPIRPGLLPGAEGQKTPSTPTQRELHLERKISYS